MAVETAERLNKAFGSFVLIGLEPISLSSDDAEITFNCDFDTSFDPPVPILYLKVALKKPFSGDLLIRIHDYDKGLIGETTLSRVDDEYQTKFGIRFPSVLRFEAVAGDLVP